MITKHHNYQYDAVSPGGIPEAAGDRYYGQDLFRDMLHTWDKIGLILKDLITQCPILLSGGVVTQGAGTTLNITLGNGYTALSVQTVDSYGSVPPTTQDEDIEAVRVAWTAQTDMALPSYTPGGATNYVKVRYLESDSSQRSRAKKAGTYYYDQEASFEFIVNTAAPTKYDLCLATFTEAMGIFTIAEYTAHKTIILTAPLINTALHILDTTESTDKDTGSIVTEGGIGVEKNLNVGGYLKSGHGVYGCAVCYGVQGCVSGNYGVYGRAVCYGVQGCASGNIGVYGYASGNYGVYGCAVCYGVYGYASGNIGVYGCAVCYGVTGYALTNYPVAGNGAYYNTSSNKKLKYKESICITQCLKDRPLPVYKYIWEDANQKGFDEFISPMSEDLQNTFKLTKEKDGMYTVDGIALGLAIENMKKIEELEKRIQELEALNGN